MKDLLVTTHTPVLRSGQMVRTYGVARAMAAQRELTLLYTPFEGAEPDLAFRSIDGLELRAAAPSRGLRRGAAYAAARLRGVPDGFARGISPELARQAARLASEADCARVVADGPIAAAALQGLARHRPVIYNAHNLESSFRSELSSEGRAAGNALRAFERSLLDSAAESWMVSEADLHAARELAPTARLRYAPNVVDVTAITPVVPSAAAQLAIFVANFAYEPNRTGLDFLLEGVLPRVWGELPEARLLLVGKGLDEDVVEDPRVEQAGFVPDLAEVYGRASCAVVPLLQGGGTPLKFVEALAYGLPIVATARAAAGLAVSDGVNCLLADDAESFAAALVRVLRDGAPSIGSGGRRLAAERYSIEALSQLLAD
ncbi:MAG TPA: glycosyltransferase [Solirubrobacteraceae bacterium]